MPMLGELYRTVTTYICYWIWSLLAYKSILLDMTWVMLTGPIPRICLWTWVLFRPCINHSHLTNTTSHHTVNSKIKIRHLCKILRKFHDKIWRKKLLEVNTSSELCKLTNHLKETEWSHIWLTCLKPRYMTLISWRVNLVCLQRSSRATGLCFGTLDGSSSKRASSMGLSGGVAMVTLAGINYSTTKTNQSYKFNYLLYDHC